MRCGRPWQLSVVLALTAGCSGQGLGGGRLSASWIGADTARFSGPATAIWCRRERYLELSAVNADTGVGLVLYPLDSLRPGVYPVFNPAGGTIQRPGAVVAARWFTETLIKGYQSDSGSVRLEMSAVGRYSGRITARLHNAQGIGLVRLTGEFAGAGKDSTPLHCPSDTVTAKPDSVVPGKPDSVNRPRSDSLLRPKGDSGVN